MKVTKEIVLKELKRKGKICPKDDSYNGVCRILEKEGWVSIIWGFDYPVAIRPSRRFYKMYKSKFVEGTVE